MRAARSWIHARSVRGLAAQHYSPETIDGWAARITDESVRALMRNPDGEIRLLAELDGGLTKLDLESSINAELFYAALGYVVVERHEHVLRSGLRMAAVRMRKEL